MARGAFRGAAGAFIGLVALQTLTTRTGSGKVAGVLNYANSVVVRAFDPNVPALPDFSAGAAATNSIGGTVPDYTLPYLAPSAVIPNLDQVPINGKPVPH